MEDEPAVVAHTYRKRAHCTSAAGASWMALVAAATLGSGQFDCIRAQVSACQRLWPAEEQGGLRLIVQSYDAGAVSADRVPREHARPLGSTQRAVTGEELRRGVAVDVLHVGERLGCSAGPVVVAWVERGLPNLEFDARTARPGRGAYFGSGRLPAAGCKGRASVVIRRRLG
jgi:hypothetical protein